MFVGAEALIDDMTSYQWIEMHLGPLGIRYKVFSNMNCKDALQIIRSSDSLVVFCSTQENVCILVYCTHIFSILFHHPFIAALSVYWVQHRLF